MKRFAGYFLCLFGLCIMFSACFYWSYQSALRKFNKNSVERNEELLRNLKEYQRQEELLLKNNEKDNTESDTNLGTDESYNTGNESVDNSVTVDSNNKDTVLPSTKYFLLTYNLKTDELLTEQLTPPAEMVGLTRAELINQLANYMKNVPLVDYEKGLYAYELLAFSKDEIIIRKSYNSNLISYRYFMVVEDGKIVVYYSDLETVYEYTNIEALYLPENTRNDLMKGIYIKDEDELFTLLESFSS